METHVRGSARAARRSSRHAGLIGWEVRRERPGAFQNLSSRWRSGGESRADERRGSMRGLGWTNRRRENDSEEERERDENRAERIGRDRRHRRGQHGHDAHERDESTAAQHDSVSTSGLYVDKA